MTAMTDASNITRAIVAAHAARFGTTSHAADSFTSDDPIYRGAKQA